jgi:CheY-like chemotaxis protein
MILFSLNNSVPQSGRKKILLIEDNIETQLMFKVYLRKYYDIETVATAEEGIEMIKHGVFDLLLLDINLPGEKDGNDVLNYIREELNMKDFPVIIVTAFALKGDKERFLERGASDYLAKPVPKELLLDKIEDHTN